MKSFLLTSLLLIFCFTHCHTFAQSDYLLAKEEKINKLLGEEKLLLMLEVAERYLEINANKSLNIIGEVEVLIGKPSKKNYKEGVMLADAYYIAGQAYQALSNYKEAEKSYLKSFQTADKFDYSYGKDRAEKMLNDLGIKTDNWLNRQLNKLSNLGLDEKLKAIKSDIVVASKVISLKEQEVRMEKYIKMGDSATSHTNYIEAIEHYKKAIILSKNIKNPQFTLHLYITMAGLFQETESLPTAIDYYDSALLYLQLYPLLVDTMLVDSLQNLKKEIWEKSNPTVVQPRKKDTIRSTTTDSLANLENTISLNIKSQEAGKVKMASLAEDAKRSEIAGDYEKAIQFREMYFAMQSKLFKDSLENVTRINELEKGRQVQAEKLKSQEELLEKEKNTKILFITSSVLLGMLALLSFYFFKNKKKSHNALQRAYTELEATLKALKVAQLKLIESEKMASLGQLTAGIAHEINNPINFVTSNITPLKRDIEDIKTFYTAFEKLAKENKSSIPASLVKLKDELEVDFLIVEMYDLLRGIEEGAGRTKEIVENFRSFARLDEEGYKKTDLKKSIVASINLLNNKAEGKVTFETDLPEYIYCECQPAKINQVIFHVLNNAVQAVQKSNKKPVGLVEIYASNNEENINIKIKDNGVGIAPEIASKVFDPFFTTRDIGQGKGLGLSIAYSIMKEHNGDITFDSSTGEVSYTEFTLMLPFKKENIQSKSFSDKLVDV